MTVLHEDLLARTSPFVLEGLSTHSLGGLRHSIAIAQTQSTDARTPWLHTSVSLAMFYKAAQLQNLAVKRTKA